MAPGGKVLSASYILDSAALSPGIAKADAELAGLEDSSADLSSKVDGHTAAMGAAFNDLGTGIGADVGAGVDDAKGKLKDLDDAGSGLESDFDKHTSKIGSMFKSLGASLGNFGIPLLGLAHEDGRQARRGQVQGAGLQAGHVRHRRGDPRRRRRRDRRCRRRGGQDGRQLRRRPEPAAGRGQEQRRELRGKPQPSIDATYDSMAKLGSIPPPAAGSLPAAGHVDREARRRRRRISAIAADLARAKHIDLSTATGILTKTLAG